MCVFKDTKQFDVERVEKFKSEKMHLHERLAELKKNGIELRRLIATINVENENATQEVMSKLQTCFKYLYRRIINCDGSWGDLKLRTAGAASNDDVDIQELEIYCTFSGDDHTEKELSFDQLTPKHKTIVALIFILAVLQSSPYALYLLDHIDEVRYSHFDHIDRQSIYVFKIFNCRTLTNNIDEISPNTLKSGAMYRNFSWPQVTPNCWRLPKMYSN